IFGHESQQCLTQAATAPACIERDVADHGGLYARVVAPVRTKDHRRHPDALTFGRQQPEYLRLRGIGRAPVTPIEVCEGLLLIPVEAGHFAGEFAAVAHLNPHPSDPLSARPPTSRLRGAADHTRNGRAACAPRTSARERISPRPVRATRAPCLLRAPGSRAA